MNLFGLYDVTGAFLPLLLRSRGAIVNNLSSNGLAAFRLVPAYSMLAPDQPRATLGAAASE
ncbi:hypothetical protein [Streptomyces sp. NRRL S-813]|uniref:hypothetical protein n=1 Tax=Streptomyces sp. NRRL S-813 TaxID=1463919 RepID=UPI0004C0FB06|nr:hypothetical protein [Streptomyces sp. NRRL S-813]